MRIHILALLFIISAGCAVAQTTDKKLQITNLTGDFYIYTTYNIYKDSKTPANGMYLVTTKGVLLFDSPWDTTQFQPLLDSIEKKHQKKVVLCIATHFHDDRAAGLDYYRQKGIKTYSTTLTNELRKKNKKRGAEFLFTSDTTFNIGNYSFDTYYPGEGHTPDNIVIWFNQFKILYGACLIKSTEVEDLGYLGDANTMEYANTVKNVLQKYPKPQYVIVGHSDWSDVKSLDHTLMLAESLKTTLEKSNKANQFSFWDSLPAPTGWVNDFEDLFSIVEERLLDSIINDFKNKTTIEIAIITLDTSATPKDRFEELTLHIAKSWGIGVKGKDNGILIGISKGYRKMRIENGRGINELLSDEETKNIIYNHFIPSFKEGDYFLGSKTGLTALIDLLKSKQ
jgi:metallo-beta-lactamase class B